MKKFLVFDCSSYLSSFKLKYSTQFNNFVKNFAVYFTFNLDKVMTVYVDFRVLSPCERICEDGVVAGTTGIIRLFKVA
jgi:hypothetical protein